MGERVLIVDDEQVLRTFVADAVKARGYEVEVASSAKEARKIASEFDPQVALLDVQLGTGPTGFDLAIALRKVNPEIGIVFLTNVAEAKVIGFDESKLPEKIAYLNKRSVSDPNLVVKAIEAAKLGVVSRNLRDDLKGEHELAEFSPAQLDVIRLVADGLSNREIAAQRDTSERAVESLLQRASKVLGIEPSEETNTRVRVAKAYIKQVGSA